MNNRDFQSKNLRCFLMVSFMYKFKNENSKIGNVYEM